MQFPRINIAVNLTLLYYNKHQIRNGVGLLSGELHPVKYTFNEIELPSWHDMVLKSHDALEDEIKQIISLNYPHVHSMVLEDLREVVSQDRIKSLDKVFITRIADEINEEGRLHLIKYPQGFSVGANKDFLPEYFAIVENALNNLKRIINKYLSLYDNDKLPKGFPLPSYIPISSLSVISAKENKRLKVNMTVDQLTMLFRLMKECKLIDVKPKNDKEIHAFISENFETTNREGVKISTANVARLWSSTDPVVLNYWIARFTEMSKKAEKK